MADSEGGIDPNQWTEPQKAVLRMVFAQGGWYTSWNDAPTAAARRAVERKAGVVFQREHGLHESPWYEPHRARDKQVLRDLAALLHP